MPPRYTAIVTLLAVVFYFFVATRVSAARRKYDVQLPAMSGHPDFDRVFRVHMNTLEWMPIFLPLLWLCAIFFGDRSAALLGLVWIAGRALYLTGYSQAVEKRLPGFAIQALACILLLIGAVTGVVMSFTAG
ncbi:MAG TPA: MAPEG family protein [Candidatus Binatia bacterium]|nr:MAPEG family protein [Candidatus Binatia bacterium]